MVIFNWWYCVSGRGGGKMSARNVARHFQRHESTISRLLIRFQQTGNVADRFRSGRPRKTTPRVDRFLTTSSRRNRFLFSRKLGRLLRNATGIRVCDSTVRNRLHAARLKACRPYADLTELSSLLLYRICNNITLGFSNMILPVHTLRGILRTFYASINVLKWTTKSLDLSSIEHIAGHKKTDLQHEKSLLGSLGCEWWAH